MGKNLTVEIILKITEVLGITIDELEAKEKKKRPHLSRDVLTLSEHLLRLDAQLAGPSTPAKVT